MHGEMGVGGTKKAAGGDGVWICQPLSACATRWRARIARLRSTQRACGACSDYVARRPSRSLAGRFKMAWTEAPHAEDFRAGVRDARSWRYAGCTLDRNTAWRDTYRYVHG